MADDLKKNRPDYICPAYTAMALNWDTMADTVAGTRRLREKGRLYLPKEPAEQDAHYGYRLERAIFFNAVERTRNGLVGMAFRNDPKLSDNVPETIRGTEAAEGQDATEGYWDNIDNAGTHGVVFLKEVFAEAMRDGHAAILVDMPPALPEGATLADEKAANRRPYWVSYCADQIINWRTEVVGGQMRLALVVLKECAKEPDGEYGQKDVTRYRVLRPGSWEVWVDRKMDNGQVEPVFEDGGTTSLTEIPLAVVYTRKTEWLESQPPLLDLALINIAHYQKYNDFSIYLHLCRPILCRKPADANKPITNISAYTVMETSETGDVWWAEPTGAGLEPSSEDLKALEERMSILGLSLLHRRTGTAAKAAATATEERNDQIEESSDLATAVRSLKDAAEQCLKWTVQIQTPSATTGGSIELGASLDDVSLTPQEMQVYSSMVMQGELTNETLWKVLGAGGKLPADFDPKQERAQLDKEAQAAADRAMAATDVPPRGMN